MSQVDVGRTRRIAVWLCAVAASCGCAGAATGTRVERPKSPAVQHEIFNTFDCPDVPIHTDEEKRADREFRFAALKLDLAADHVRLVQYVSENETWTFASRGEACATAAPKAACETALAQLMVTGGAKEQVFAITIEGDQLKLYEGRAVLTLLGPTNNVDKAWVALMIAENEPSYLCQMPDWNSWRETAGGYELAWVWTDSICRPVQRLQAIDYVDRAGNVTRLRTNVVEHVPDACIMDGRPIHQEPDHGADEVDSQDSEEPEPSGTRRRVLR